MGEYGTETGFAAGQVHGVDDDVDALTRSIEWPMNATAAPATMVKPRVIAALVAPKLAMWRCRECGLR